MFYEKRNEGYLLRVRINPCSSSCQILGILNFPDGDYLKVSIISVPEKGKANKELVDFLAKQLKIAKANIEILAGKTDKYKKIFIHADDERIGRELDEYSKNN